jgi:small subunit ribosomal protein S21
MIIVEVGKSIEKALKKYKEKYIKLKISKQINERKEYEKPTVTKRKVKNKAIFIQKKKKENGDDF